MSIVGSGAAAVEGVGEGRPSEPAGASGAETGDGAEGQAVAACARTAGGEASEFAPGDEVGGATLGRRFLCLTGAMEFS